MKYLFLVLFYLLCCISFANAGEPVFSKVKAADGVEFQICTKYPDAIKFPGRRPALMIIMGSGRSDSCASLGKEYADSIVAKGVILFARQKRGLFHDPISKNFSMDEHIYAGADLPTLKRDTLVAFDALLKDTLVDPKRTAVWGGSEGTIMATYIGNHHPEIREVGLANSMIESFTSLFERQYYSYIPQEFIKSLDADNDGKLSSKELTPDLLKQSGLRTFGEIDLNNDGFVDSSELIQEIHRAISFSLLRGDNTFFLSDLGGGVTVPWIRSAFRDQPLGPQILKLGMPVIIYHGTADQNTLVGPRSTKGPRDWA